LTRLYFIGGTYSKGVQGQIIGVNIKYVKVKDYKGKCAWRRRNVRKGRSLVSCSFFSVLSFLYGFSNVQTLRTFSTASSFGVKRWIFATWFWRRCLELALRLGFFKKNSSFENKKFPLPQWRIFLPNLI